MIVSKIRKPFLNPLSWLPYTDWLWLTTLSIDVAYTPPTEYVTLGYTFDEYNELDVEIGQVFVDNIPYTQTVSLASCIAQEKSWYIDIAAQELYVHADHGKRMDSSTFDSLEVRGYATSSPYTGLFYDENGFPFLPLLRTNLKISDEVDRGVAQKSSFVSNTLVFDNLVSKATGEGAFDYAFISKVPGADVNILYISEEDVKAGKKSLTPIYTGFVESDEIKADTYKIVMADKREQLNNKIPNVKYDATTYPLMDKDLGKLIPEGYGDIIGLPAACINDTVTTGNVLYKYATDGTTLTKVEVQIDDVWEEVTPTASSGTACTFTLATDDGRTSSGNPLKARVNCRLRDIDVTGLILKDMITRYIGSPFNADYFDFTTWTDESSLLGDIAFVMTDRKTFFEWIELIQNGSTKMFIFRLNQSGKYSIKADDITRTVSGNYDAIENIGPERTALTDFTQYATDVIVKYNQNISEKEYQDVTDDQFKAETLSTYRLDKEIELKTLLTSEADAEERALNALKEFKIARPLFTIKLRGILSNIGLLDVVIFDSAVYFNGTKFREYAGSVKMKIASYDYDTGSNITTLSGYQINDIISKGTEVYAQGELAGIDLCGFTSNVGITGTFTQEEG